jgi:hypothetical protein
VASEIEAAGRKINPMILEFAPAWALFMHSGALPDVG